MRLVLKSTMRVFAGFLIMFLLQGQFLWAQDGSRISTLLAEADVLISENKLDDALARTREAITLSQDNHQALQKQINILFLMNDEKESLRVVDNAIHEYPNIADYYYLRGIINNAREKYVKALDDFTQAIDLNPSEILYRCYLGRGVSYMNLLEYTLAIADLTASIEQNDTVASAYHSRAMVNYELRDYSAAVKDFLRTLDFSKGNATLYFNLGMSYYRLDEKEKACPNFHKSCTMGNTNACRMTLMECAKAIPIIP
jgi:tetratricopeptide (TPR) repeat protein